MIKIVAQTGYEEAKNLQVGHKTFHLASFEHSEHCLGYIQSVSPVVVLDRSVVFFNAKNPAAENLERKPKFIILDFIESKMMATRVHPAPLLSGRTLSNMLF